jgi:hypothetical protein
MAPGKVLLLHGVGAAVVLGNAVLDLIKNKWEITEL